MAIPLFVTRVFSNSNRPKREEGLDIDMTKLIKKYTNKHTIHLFIYFSKNSFILNIFLK